MAQGVGDAMNSSKERISSEDDLERLRQVHALRIGGRVELPVLVGASDVAKMTWKRWAELSHLTHASLELHEDSDPACLWLHTLDNTGRFSRWVLERVAQVYETTADDLKARFRGATEHDIGALWARAARVASWPQGCEAECERQFLAALRSLKGSPLGRPTERPATEFVRALSSSLPETLRPALLLCPSSDDPKPVRRVLRVVQRVPVLPLAIQVRQADLQSLCAALSDIEAAMLREGSIVLSAASGETEPSQAWIEEVQSLLAQTSGDAPTLEDVRRVSRSGSDQPLFRSGAEALLFAYLERWPETRGRFKPNARPGFLFGDREAELDFYSEAERLVIELDGSGFHLPSDRQELKQCYRRDRAKDWVIQRHGLRVVRFLSEDVGPLISTIRDRVGEALRSNSHEGLPP